MHELCLWPVQSIGGLIETTSMEQVSEDIVRSLLLLGSSCTEISTELKRLYPHISRGLSARSIRRYIKDHKLREALDRHKEDVIEESVQEVSLIIFVPCGKCLMMTSFSLACVRTGR